MKIILFIIIVILTTALVVTLESNHKLLKKSAPTTDAEFAVTIKPGTPVPFQNTTAQVKRSYTIPEIIQKLHDNHWKYAYECSPNMYHYNIMKGKINYKDPKDVERLALTLAIAQANDKKHDSLYKLIIELRKMIPDSVISKLREDHLKILSEVQEDILMKEIH
jgi:hypothetical protein